MWRSVVQRVRAVNPRVTEFSETTILKILRKASRNMRDSGICIARLLSGVQCLSFRHFVLALYANVENDADSLNLFGLAVSEIFDITNK